MAEFADETDCVLCGEISPSELDAFRASLDRMPLKEPVCDACLMAFWRNLGLPVSDTDEPVPDEPTEH
jgi:hypothetical protein